MNKTIDPDNSPRPQRKILGWLCLIASAFAITFALTKWANQPPTPPPGMVYIPAGSSLMGSPNSLKNRNEQPAHMVQLDGFFLDEHEVTNRQFQAFVDATSYVTTAEKSPDWEELKKQLPPGTPKPPAAKLVPGSLVFTPPTTPVPTNDPTLWWTWTPGADWRHPEGPSSNIDSRLDHPVVQVSWFDAVAYATWAGKRLPTEAEWEYSARGGLTAKNFTWGDNPPNDADKLANIWHGVFPHRNDKSDGWDRTAPVKSFPPNAFGLFDMAGNTWEWCADWYRADAYADNATKKFILNPQGPIDSWSPDEPLAPKKVIRGGSFLCHASYCESYRPAARRGTSPDTGMSHIGFRCAQSPHKIK